MQIIDGIPYFDKPSKRHPLKSVRDLAPASFPTCPACKGSGCEGEPIPGVKGGVRECPECKGTGVKPHPRPPRRGKRGKRG